MNTNQKVKYQKNYIRLLKKLDMKIGSEKFIGIKKNLFYEYKEKPNKNIDPIINSFDEYLKNHFFDIKK